MSYLKYYADERRRYPAEGEMAISIADMNAVAALLCEELGFKACPIELNPRRRSYSVFWHRRATFLDGDNAFISPRGIRAAAPHIEMSSNMLNVRVFLHELAHWVHSCEFDARFRKNDGRYRTREQWHGIEHRIVMRKLVKRYHDLMGTAAEKKEELMAAGA